MRNAAAEQRARRGSGAGLVDRDVASVHACRPTPSPRSVLGSPFGVAMFLKRCDPGGLCSASSSTCAGGLDDGRYGSEELGPLRSPHVGAAEERGAVVTLHSGQSCRGTPGPRGSTAGTGPAGTGVWSAQTAMEDTPTHSQGHSHCSQWVTDLASASAGQQQGPDPDICPGFPLPPPLCP